MTEFSPKLHLKVKMSEDEYLVSLSEVKWSENFSLKIYVKVKKSESHILVFLSEVKWSEILSLNLHFRVKISESWISEKLSEVKWSKWASPSLHLHLSEKNLSEFASLAGRKNLYLQSTLKVQNMGILSCNIHMLQLSLFIYFAEWIWKSFM